MNYNLRGSVGVDGPPGISEVNLYEEPALAAEARDLMTRIAAATGLTHNTNAWGQQLFLVLQGDQIALTTAQIINPDIPDPTDPANAGD